MIEPETGERPVNSAKPSMRQPVLITCLSLAVAALLFVGGAAVGYAAGQWGETPAATGAPSADEGAAATLRAKFPLFWEAMEVLYLSLIHI